MRFSVLALLVLLPRTLNASSWPCPQQADVDGDGSADTVSLSLSRASIRTARTELAVPLPAPAVLQVCLGDLDSDGKAEILTRVIHATETDQVLRQRLFLYGEEGGSLRPRFLGTSGAGFLRAVGVADLNQDQRMEILAREGSADGEQTHVYRLQAGGLVEVRELAANAPAFGETRGALEDIPVIDLTRGTGVIASSSPQPLCVGRSTGKIRPVKIRSGLSNVANRGQVRFLPAEAHDRLVKDGFVVYRPAEAAPEFHSLYIDNLYRGLPSFVTADAALHMTHLLVDQALQAVEEEVLAKALKRLVDGLRRRATELGRRLPALFSSDLDRILLRLEIASVLLDADLSSVGAVRRTRVAQAVSRVEGVGGPGNDPTGFASADFLVRGHYARSEVLRRYFRSFRYLSRTATESQAEAVLLTLLVASDSEILKLLVWLDAFGRLMIGPAAGPTPLSFLDEIRKHCGERVDLTALDPAKCGKSTGITLLAGRWPADNDLILAGVDPEHRLVPSPLDLLSVMGSIRARQLLQPEVLRWPELATRLDQAALALHRGSLGDPLSIGGRWLLALRWVLLPFPPGYASFQQTEAWSDHSLVSAASSFAEMRRDTILYVQPPIVWAEGGDEESLPPARAGFVEPLPELYAELGGILSELRTALVAFGGPGVQPAGYLRQPPTVLRLSGGEDLLSFLEAMARKELAGKPLDREEHEQLSGIGNWMERILAGSGRVQMDPVPVVADVYYLGDPETRSVKPWLVATGPVDEILVGITLGSRIVLARGGVSAFYTMLADAPLSDQQWRRMLEEGRAPAQPDWARPAMQLKQSTPKRRQ